jgi:hypothetical protein
MDLLGGLGDPGMYVLGLSQPLPQLTNNMEERPLIKKARELANAGPGFILLMEEKLGHDSEVGHVFHTRDANEFLDNFCRTGYPRHHHEALRVDKPMKVAVDVEAYEDKEPDRFARKDEIVSQVERDVERCIREKLGAEPGVPYRLWSSRPGKFSVHIVWDVWMSTPRGVGWLLEGVPEIDQQVYPGRMAKVCKWMRLPFSEKVEHPGYPLAPEGWVKDQKWPAVSRDDVIRGSWTLGTPSHVYTSPEDPCESEDKATFSGDTAKAERILDYLNTMRGPFKMDEVEEDGPKGWSCIVRPGMFCQVQGRQHRRQNGYICSKDGRRVFYRCPDEECKVKSFFPEDFTYF